MYKILKLTYLILTTIILSTPASAQDKNDPDQRINLLLSADERHLVLSEMRGFVITIDGILDGIAMDDFEKVAKISRTMGSAAANTIPPQTVAKLPENFKQLASQVHGGFDMIALDAESMGDTNHTISQLSRITKNCIACHATYKIQTIQRRQ